MRSILVCPSLYVEQNLGKSLERQQIAILTIDHTSDSTMEFLLNGTRLAEEYFCKSALKPEFLSIVSNRLVKEALVIARWESRSKGVVSFDDAILSDLIRLNGALASGQFNRAVFFTPVYHHRHTFMVDIVCDYLGIERVYLYPNQVNGDLLPLIIEKGGIENRKLLRVNGTSSKVDIFDFIERCELSKKPASYERDNLEIGFYQSAFFAVLYCFYRSLKAKFTSNEMLRYYSKLGFFNECKLIIQQKRFVNDYKKIQKSKIKDIVFNKSIIIASHTQPEASSVPEGGLVKSHVELIIRLKSQGFVGDVYYKEHPASFRFFDKYVGPTKAGQFRYPNYITQLSQFGVNFLCLSSNLLTSVSGKYPMIITMTGTIALERALLGLRTIVTGYPWFIACPGVMHIDKVEFTNGEFNQDWLKPDSLLASEARAYIETCLSESGIPNPEGIGNLHPYENKQDTASFYQALEAICQGDLM